MKALFLLGCFVMSSFGADGAENVHGMTASAVISKGIAACKLDRMSDEFWRF